MGQQGGDGGIGGKEHAGDAIRSGRIPQPDDVVAWALTPP